jgi:hypothetical protein
MAVRSRIPNIKVDDQKTELALRAIKRQIDNPVMNSDIEFINPLEGVILRDELGGRWRITVDSTGTLITTSI